MGEKYLEGYFSRCLYILFFLLKMNNFFHSVDRNILIIERRWLMPTSFVDKDITKLPDNLRQPPLVQTINRNKKAFPHQALNNIGLLTPDIAKAASIPLPCQ